MIREDFPEPETPVTQRNVPSGNLTSIFFRLFCLAPLTSINFPLPFLRVCGTGIFLAPVIDFSQAIISSTVPAQTSSPP